jgi:hypothetical protein
MPRPDGSRAPRLAAALSRATGGAGRFQIRRLLEKELSMLYIFAVMEHLGPIANFFLATGA